jgi:uncharacterized protein (TIGR02145 family)
MKKHTFLALLILTLFVCLSMSAGFEPNILGTLKDARDGKTYKTIMIGKKEWMAQNLNYKSEHSFAINNDEAVSEKLGRLYTWKAVEGKTLCPKGWHVPSKKEWGEVFKNLKLTLYDSEKDGSEYRYKDAVAAFEQIGFLDKDSFAGTFHDITEKPDFKYTYKTAMFWTSTPAGSYKNMELVWLVDFYNEIFDGNTGVLVFGEGPRDISAISCRCVKD